MKNLLIIISILLAFCSCKKGNYIDAIPCTATALVAIDGATPLLSEIPDIDTTKTVYLFELAGGEMGLCAMDTDGDPMLRFLNEEDQHISKLKESMEDYDPDNTIRNSELWKHLNETIRQNPQYKMHMVVQTNVLPKQMQACLMLGAPKGTDPADLLLETGITYADSTLTLNGHTCAYDMMREQMVEKTFKNFKPVTLDWQSSIQPNTLLGIYINVEGTEFIPLLQKNKALNMMLMGSGAIDRIRNNHGNMAIIGTIDNKWSVEMDLGNSGIRDLGNSKDKLIVCLNMKSLPKELDQVIGFMTKKINRIVYKVE